MKREMMFLNCGKQKRNHTLPAVRRGGVCKGVGAYFDLRKRWGSTIKFKKKIEKSTQKRSVASLSQNNTMWTKFEISKFLLFLGGKEWKFWSEFQTKFKKLANKIDTRGLPVVAELSVDPNRANPGKGWEEFHQGLAEGGPIPSGFRPGSV